MNTSLHTVRALLVSSSEAQTQRISALLSTGAYRPVRSRRQRAAGARTV